MGQRSLLLPRGWVSRGVSVTRLPQLSRPISSDAAAGCFPEAALITVQRCPSSHWNRRQPAFPVPTSFPSAAGRFRDGTLLPRPLPAPLWVGPCTLGVLDDWGRPGIPGVRVREWGQGQGAGFL